MIVQYRYEPFRLKDIIGEKTIKIPQFQRNVVWNQKKRKEFVETLCNGNPFGSILVHQNEKKEYYLIDGLQRVSTIKNYYKNPFEYFDYKILNEELTKDLIKHNYEIKGYQYDKDSEAVKQCCIDIQKTIFRRLANDENTTHIIFEILNEYSIISDEKSFSILTNIMEEVKKNMDC